ncbi:MAG: histidine phosphatase family protein [Nitratireductor sp.]|nr:histidine phosphatase family protein [Nitratireductor sp.]
MIFLRHPTPRVDPGICYGRLDIDITEQGREQIARALETTPRITRLLASPALRCRALAQALAERDGIEPVFDERLWEMDMGEWEGLDWRDIPREVSEPWSADPYNLPTPGGESFRDLQVRVLEALAGVGRETAIVCHAGPIRAMQMAWHGLTFREAFTATPGYAEPIELHPAE